MKSDAGWESEETGWEWECRTGSRDPAYICCLLNCLKKHRLISLTENDDFIEKSL